MGQPFYVSSAFSPQISLRLHLVFNERLEIYSSDGMMDGTLVQNLNVMNVPSRRRNPVIADILYAING